MSGDAAGWSPGEDRAARASRRAIILASPEAAAGVSLLIALGCLFFPPRLYQQLLSEPDRIYLDGDALLFILLCGSSFALGLAMGRQLVREVIDRSPPGSGRSTLVRGGWARQAAITLIFACAFLLVANALFLLQFLRHVSLAKLILALKLEDSSRLVTKETLGLLKAGNYWIPIFGQAVTQLAFWVWLSGQRVLPPGRRRVLGVLCGALGFSVSLVLLTTLKRGPILGFCFALLAVFILHLYYERRLSLRRLFRYGVALLLFGVAYFGFTQIAKNIGSRHHDSRAVGSAVVAYYVGSYNRLSYIIDGDLKFGHGDGYYWTRPVWEFSALNYFLGLDAVAEDLFRDLPPSGAQERTVAIGSASLAPNYTSITAFGMSFVDFGWWGFIPFLPYGILAAVLWRLYRRGSYWGVMLYPMVLWSVVEWRGYLEIARETILGYAVFAVLLWQLTRFRLAAPPRRPAWAPADVGT